jgi:hypothetical protein
LGSPRFLELEVELAKHNVKKGTFDLAIAA